MGPVACVPSDFGNHGDQAYLPTNLYNWVSFFAVILRDALRYQTNTAKTAIHSETANVSDALATL